MLKLKGITKNYKVAGGEIQVLKGLDISFRKNEFVSILGPSGCGKTTTLNIVGGLDKYTSGDLFIAGKSTKNFTDRDWDVYRNHRIGFIFQSYNLIPHQTVLGNVELALTIAGVSKEERVKRSIAALDRVGLQGEYYKRPNQLSGGQCQRVAIARALVNEPDILLADEPTGALDSKTSVQIMDLIKEISNEKLVIMVTHNAEIAEQYSTRIVRLVDGEITEDTNPFSEEEEKAELENDVKPDEKPTDSGKNVKKQKKIKAKMSWWTAFKLSARNLFTKRGRTAMTSIAGSIGIIGISAVLAVSTGVRTFIADMQDDMLSGNPITIEETGYDLDAMMNGLTIDDSVKLVQKEGYVNVESMMKFLAEQYTAMDNLMVTNDITKEYIDYVKAMPEEYASVKFDYGLDVTNNIYTDFYKNNTDKENVSLSAIKTIYTSILEQTQFKDQTALIASLGEIYMQAPNDNEYILTQYDIKEGEIADEAHEIMLVVNKDAALTDLLLAQLGYYSQDEFLNIAYKVGDDPDYDANLDKDRFSYQELLNKTFTWYDNDVVYKQNTGMEATVRPFGYNYKNTGFENGKQLTVVGILQPKEDISFGCLEAGMYYTEAFADYILSESADSKIVTYFNNIIEQGGEDTISSTVYMGNAMGITYEYQYTYKGTTSTATGFVGKMNLLAALPNMMPGGAGGSTGTSNLYQLSLRNVGGRDLANSISIYPADFEMKDKVTEYLDKWNDENQIISVNGTNMTFEDRSEIVYTDTLSIIISMIDTMINVITIALVAFTSLSLVVSCVMIAIITYVSVVERIKEIGVIRSLGGRKRDVSNLFNAETLVIGTTSGLFGLFVTYMISIIVNVIVKNLAGISTIMLLPIPTALIMLGLSIGLTVLSGLIPSRKAAHQDPVVALRTE